MKIVDYLKKIYLSLYSGEEYARAASDTGFRKGLYLLFISFLAFLPLFVFIAVQLNGFINNEFAEIITQVPKVNIQGGKVISEVEQPYYISLPEITQYAFVLDTTGQYKSMDDVDTFVLMTKDKIFYHSLENKVTYYDLALVDYYYFDGYTILEFSQKLLVISLVLTFIFAPPFLFLIRLGLVYLLSLLFSAFRIGRENALSYQEILRVACLAMTPALIARAVIDIIPSDVKGGFFIVLLIFTGFLFYGITSAVRLRKSGVVEDIPKE